MLLDMKYYTFNSEKILKNIFNKALNKIIDEVIIKTEQDKIIMDIKNLYV